MPVKEIVPDGVNQTSAVQLFSCSAQLAQPPQRRRHRPEWPGRRKLRFSRFAKHGEPVSLTSVGANAGVAAVAQVLPWSK